MQQKTLAKDVREALCALSNKDKAVVLSRFFKTGKGQYGEGDLFLGIPMPLIRSVVKEVQAIDFEEIDLLINDPYHEVRMCGFLILVKLFSKNKSEEKRQQLVSFYLEHADKANNWDLVDLSAPKILGIWLKDHDKQVLYDFAKSNNLWKQRIAMVSNWMLIRDRQYDDAIQIALILIDHPHDLIQKAVGWMLREVGKKDEALLIRFLDEHATQLSRTSLRYAIERLPYDVRQYYMKK